jgi:hypothetical protein
LLRRLWQWWLLRGNAGAAVPATGVPEPQGCRTSRHDGPFLAAIVCGQRDAGAGSGGSYSKCRRCRCWHAECRYS